MGRLTKEAMELAAKILRGGDDALDRSTKARMARAEEQGYGDPVYHATERNFEEFIKTPQPNMSYGYQDKGLPGSWFTSSPSRASDIYSNVPYPPPDHAETGANIIEARLRLNNPLVYEAEDAVSPMVRASVIKREMRKPKSERADGVVFRAIDKDGATVDDTFVFKPSNIRSVNAAFDPAKKDSSNLLASLGGAAAVGAAAMTPKDAEAAYGTIEAPKNPTALKLANAIRELDRRTKGSPANLVVPTGTADFLTNVAYNKKTKNLDKVMAAMEWLP